MDENGSLSRLREKVHIGQGYKNQQIDGLGVGSCTSGCTHHLKGCPPSALEIVRFLERYI
jgi:hypothetical protein